MIQWQCSDITSQSQLSKYMLCSFIFQRTTLRCHFNSVKLIQMYSKCFEGTNHSAVYADFRPSPPQPLIQSVLDYLGEKIPKDQWKCAIDVGSGSGQNTKLIAPHFQRVFGFDVSQTQISEGNKRNQFSHVVYKVAPCDNLPVESKSAQLLTVSQAAHWFDLDKFFAEADRVLVPNGVLALYASLVPFITHPNFMGDQRVADLVWSMYINPILPWKKVLREKVDTGYATIALPYDNGGIRKENIMCTQMASANQLKGYLMSWSAYQQIENKDDAKKFLNEFDEKIKNIFGDDDFDKITFQLNYPYFLLMGRKPN